jgi:quinol monooxygenase YgiN
MALVPLASKGNFVHVYDFRVKPGTGDEFIRLFDEFDYSDANPMHKSSAQVKDGVLCRDVQDPDHFYLLGEWADIKVHAEIRKTLAETLKPEFVKLIEGGKFVPIYAEIVSSTPQHVLEKAAR